MAMGEEEELYESEVMWPEASHDHDAPASCSSSLSVAPLARRGVLEKPRYPGGSRPVDIPTPARSTWRRDDDVDNGGRGGAMVPPHVLVSRRRSEGDAAFALRSRPGRARELSHLRHFVLRRTGFIEG
jgi:hypothetical protein